MYNKNVYSLFNHITYKIIRIFGLKFTTEILENSLFLNLPFPSFQHYYTLTEHSYYVMYTNNIIYKVKISVRLQKRRKNSPD